MNGWERLLGTLKANPEGTPAETQQEEKQAPKETPKATRSQRKPKPVTEQKDEASK